METSIEGTKNKVQMAYLQLGPTVPPGSLLPEEDELPNEPNLHL